jgi:hypothetical protein
MRDIVDEINSREFKLFLEKGIRPEFIYGIDFYNQLFNLKFFSIVMFLFFMQAGIY